jgi:hypothetical protein
VSEVIPNGRSATFVVELVGLEVDSSSAFHVCSAALYRSGGGCPALHRASELVVEKKELTIAVANRQSLVASAKCRFIEATNGRCPILLTF